MKKRVLESKVIDNWKGYPLITLSVDEIWQSVPSVDTLRGRPFKGPLREDILENGMKFPILVVEVSYQDLREAKRRYRKKICALPSDKFWGTEDPNNTKIWSVWGGSQRLTFAKEEGYTHIHCAVIPTIQESISLQRKMRAPFPDLYGKGKRNR